LFRNTQANNNVNGGETLANAFELVTLILWIPSTHKIFENPNKKKPLIKMRTAELLTSAMENFSLTK
jgi:hypothetical protein